MSYDLDEQYIDTRKTSIATLRSEIDDLDKVTLVFRVESDNDKKEIEQKIEYARNGKRTQIQTLINEIIQHCKDVIGI